MSNKLDQLRERGVIRDEIHSFSNLVFAEGMRQIHPDRVFIDVSKDERSGPYLQASEADAARLEAEGYRRLHIHAQELAQLSEALRLAGAGVKWPSKRTPMHALLPLAVKARVVKPGTTAEDLLKISVKISSRPLGGGSTRLMLEQLTGFAVLWTYVSWRLNPQDGWGPADKLAEETRTALGARSESELLGYVNAQHKALQGGLMLALALAAEAREQTKNAASTNKAYGEASDVRIKVAAKPYMKSGRNWISKKDAAEEIAKKLGKDGKYTYIHKRLCALFPGDAWPKKPRKA